MSVGVWVSLELEEVEMREREFVDFDCKFVKEFLEMVFFWGC